MAAHNPTVFPPSYKPHPDWPGYGGDPDGNIYSEIPGRVPRRLKPWAKSCGHLCVSLRREGKTHRVLVHRFILELFVGPCPPGMEACHGEEGPAVNAARNLRWDTRRENTLDRLRHGKTIKLSPDDVREIRRIGKPLRQHAERFGVSEALVGMILSKRIWSHVE